MEPDSRFGRSDGGSHWMSEVGKAQVAEVHDARAAVRVVRCSGTP